MDAQMAKSTGLPAVLSEFHISGLKKGLTPVLELLESLLLRTGHRLFELNRPRPALHFMQLAARAGLPSAAHELGLLFESGQGVEVNPAEARRWFRKAADAGHVASMLRLARLSLVQHHSFSLQGAPCKTLYENAPPFMAEPEIARRYALRAAEQGNIDGMALAGYLFATGKGGPVDVETALRFYGAAFAAGHVEAGLGLGTLLISGQAGKPDHASALRCFQMAAGSGNATARYFLGLMSLRGMGGERDERKAITMFAAAARKGHRPSIQQLAKWHLEDGRTASQRKAGISWLKKLASFGDMNACIELSRRYRLGQDVPVSPIEMVYWLEKSAWLGDSESQYRLGMALMEGQNMAQDPGLGESWLKAAAHQGYSPAMMELEDLENERARAAQEQLETLEAIAS
jgi:uncharacterized protein